MATAKKTKVNRLLLDLDAEITRLWDTYRDEHTKLDKHRGKPLEDTNLNEVNEILKNIQEVFAELNEVLYFIAYRHQFAIAASNQHNEFIESIKKNIVNPEVN